MPKGPPAPRMAGGPFGTHWVVLVVLVVLVLPVPLVLPLPALRGQEALAFWAGAETAAGAGAGLAAS